MGTLNPAHSLTHGDTRQKLLITIGQSQLQFFGHVMRKEEMEGLFITRKIEGKWDRGRQWLGVKKKLLFPETRPTLAFTPRP